MLFFTAVCFLSAAVPGDLVALQIYYRSTMLGLPLNLYFTNKQNSVKLGTCSEPLCSKTTIHIFCVRFKCMKFKVVFDLIFSSLGGIMTLVRRKIKRGYLGKSEG